MGWKNAVPLLVSLLTFASAAMLGTLAGRFIDESRQHAEKSEVLQRAEALRDAAADLAASSPMIAGPFSTFRFVLIDGVRPEMLEDADEVRYVNLGDGLATMLPYKVVDSRDIPMWDPPECTPSASNFGVVWYFDGAVRYCMAGSWETLDELQIESARP